MRKIEIIFVLLLLSISLSAQLKSGFDKNEARDMIALCNSFTFLKLFNSDRDIVPASYEKVYTSGVYGLDNKFQVWRNASVAVIVFRGSTAEKSSWLENMYSVMIPANGKIVLPGMDTLIYRFAKADSACVHAGWSLGISFLIQDVIHEIRLLNSEGVFDIIITGHSQGGALAHLCRAYLENLSKGKIADNNNFKTYAFASPMVGNTDFVEEYKQRFVANKTSFSIYNPKDLVPQMPITVNDNKQAIYTLDNLKKVMDSTSSVTWKSLAIRGVTRTLTKDPVAAYMKMAGDDIYEEIVKLIGPFEMPSYTHDLVYVSTENRLSIGSFDEFENQIVTLETKCDTLSQQTIEYRERIRALRGGKMYQHKPYNYYLYFLKKYFKNDYERLLNEENFYWNRP
jgi:hypothetical protein